LGFDLNVKPNAETISKELLYTCHKNKFQIHDCGEKLREPPASIWLHYLHRRHVVTLVMLPQITDSCIKSFFHTLAEQNVNVVKMERLTVKDLGALQLTVDLPENLDAEAFQTDLVAMSSAHGADVAFQRDDMHRWMRRVVVFDMDSTLIEGEVIDELAKIAGVEEEVSSITKAAMRGEINFFDSLKQRVALLKGHNADDLFAQVKANLKYSPGTEKLCGVLKKLGYKMAVISGGFLPMAEEVQRHLGLDYAFANSLEVDEKGMLTGRTSGPVVTPERKRALLGTIANVEGCEIRQTIAVGDGANDIPMLKTAGLGIAFMAKPKVQAVSKFRINQKDMSTLLFLIGISEHAAERLLPSRALSSASQH
jgi:phosphoserine phosphatase SerB